MNYSGPENDTRLLTRFNDRDSDAVGEVYMRYYWELHTFAARLFRETDACASDIIHDVFLSIFTTRRRFDTLEGVKAYVYVAIKNKFRDYLSHSTHVTDYRKTYLGANDAFETDMIEAEYYSVMQHALKLLPKDCARIFRLFLEGWDAEEIAVMTGKNIRTVYNRKHDSIRILKEKLSPDKLLLLNIL